jgi:peptidoglycan-associated lipoprotein
MGMMKKGIVVLMAMAFICSSAFFLTSCAKKQVKVEEPTVAEEKKAPEVEKGDTDAYRKAEAERQARLRELEKSQQVRDDMNVFTSDNIYFDFDRSELLPQAKNTLREKAQFLKKYPDFYVRIEGHCDERGTNEYNLALGERRAQSAKNFLVSLGIDAKRLRTISYGEERPADPRSNEAGWALNRRDEFKLLK